ncbi:MAG: hypothetical protein R3B82_17265 [Sandaracinaceae bacterium]
MPRTLRFALALFLVACDGSGGADAGTDATDAGVGDAGEDAMVDACTPTPDDPFGCEDLTPDPACPASWVVGVTGRIETADGAAVENARAQLCVRLYPDDLLTCLPPPVTDAEGRFAIVVDDGARCQNHAAMRAIAPGMPLATTYCPVDYPAGGGPIFEIPDPYALHPVVDATDLPPVGDESAQRDVTFADGLVLTLAPVDIPLSGDYERLAGAPIDPAAAACFSGGLVLDGAYGFRPETPVDAGAAVSIPNTAGLDPGTEVDLYVLGGLETRLLDGTEVEEGTIGLVGPATVSADGTAIVGGADSRLPYLSWLLWKVR